LIKSLYQGPTNSIAQGNVKDNLHSSRNAQASENIKNKKITKPETKPKHPKLVNTYKILWRYL